MVASSNVHSLVKDNRTGPDANMLVAVSQMAAVGYKLPNQLAGSGGVATNDTVFGGRVDKAIRHCRRRIRICTDARLPNVAAVNGVDAIQVTALSPEVDAAILHSDAAFDRAYQYFVNQFAISQIQAVEVVVFASEINAAVSHDARAINFKTRFEIPNQRPVFRIQAVEMMVEPAGKNLVVQNEWCSFKTVLAFELPDHAAIIFVKAIDIAVSRWKINAVAANRRLARPGRSAPWILMITPSDKFRLKFPYHF